MKTTSPRETALAVLRGEKPDRIPCFGGLPSVTVHGWREHGWRYGELHADAEKMIVAAASTWRLFGFESAVVPFDLTVEAEALGCAVDLYIESVGTTHPAVTRRLADDPGELRVALPSDLAERGRLPVVLAALRRLKAEVGQEIVVGAWVPGPFTLAWQVTDPQRLLSAVAAEPESVSRALDQLTKVVAAVAELYKSAGADFLTVHEMGGAPGVIGPRAFRRLVQPRLQRLFAVLPSPHVLSVCGKTDAAVEIIAECGADALNFDHQNDLARTRRAVGDKAVLLGNYDPVGTLARGSPEDVQAAVKRSVASGADAVWPGCDLWPEVPAENMIALLDATRTAMGRAIHAIQ